MTVYNELNKIAYIGSIEQTLYPIPFEYISTDDIKVSVYTSNNEFVEDWTYSIQYVIEGGNVKVLSGYNIDNTKKLLILRRVDLIQDNKYREGGDFPAKSTETSFDKLTMITQQLQETLDRCVKVEVLDIQTPEELLQTVYDKLDSATEIAGDAINAANQAQTAADNATAAVNSAEQTLVQTQAYVDAAKVEIDNTRNTAVETINSTVSTAKADINSAIDEATMDISNTSTAAISTINTAVSNAESNISTIVSDAEGSITNIAVTEANKAIANAAQEATDIATANVNSYVDGTVKPSLQTYVDQAQENANSAATSMEQAALSATAASNYASNASADADNAAESAGLAANSAAAAATSETNAKTSETNALIWAEGTDSEVQALGGEKSAKGWAKASTAVNYTNITNCITEIPQDIKLELNNGTLTLKAGSKVYVPNGFEADGVTPKFDEVNISSDMQAVIPDSNRNGSFLTYNVNGRGQNMLHWSQWNPKDLYSGPTAPTSSGNKIWYDTTNNVIKEMNDGTNWEILKTSFPFCTFSGTPTTVTSIDQVFNGFGYIGSTVFALPGVKGLIPNGRNEDGSLNNTEYVTSSVLTRTISGVTLFNEFAIVTTGIGINKHTLNEPENYIYNAEGTKLTDRYVAGNITFSKTAPYEVTSFTPKTAFHAVDDSAVVHKDLDEVITGYKTFKNSHSGEMAVFQTNNIDSTTAPSDTTYTGIDIRDKNGTRIGKVEVGHKTSGVILASLSVSRKIDGTMKYRNLSVAIDSSGNGWIENLRPDYGSLVGLGMKLGTAKTMPADGVLFINVQVGSQSNSTVSIYDGSGHAIGVVKHNGGSAELNCSTFTAIVAKGQSINCSHNGAGNASIVSSYLAPWK